MCKAVREMRRVLRNEGRREGMEKGMAKGMEKGIAKGMEKGMAKGMAKGMERGKVKGIALGEEKVLLSMLRRNASPELIHQLTGISLKRILAVAAADVPSTVTP